MAMRPQWCYSSIAALGSGEDGDGGSNQSGGNNYKNYENIIGIITPDDRRHNITNLLSTGATGSITSDSSIAKERDVLE